MELTEVNQIIWLNVRVFSWNVKRVTAVYSWSFPCGQKAFFSQTLSTNSFHGGWLLFNEMRSVIMVKNQICGGIWVSPCYLILKLVALWELNNFVCLLLCLFGNGLPSQNKVPFLGNNPSLSIFSLSIVSFCVSACQWLTGILFLHLPRVSGTESRVSSHAGGNHQWPATKGGIWECQAPVLSQEVIENVLNGRTLP